MHIISGLAIALLVGKLQNDKALKGLPRFNLGPVRVAHVLPGRIRFLVPGLRNAEEQDLSWFKDFRTLDGVIEASLNTVTGSVLVRYDAQEVDPPLLFGALVRMLGVEAELEKSSTPLIMRELRALGQSLNFSVYNASYGILDLRTLLIAGLLVVGTKKTMESGWAAFPAGFTLLWWALNSMTTKGADAT